MAKTVIIKKAVGNKYIVEQNGSLPEVYDTFSDVITNIFCGDIWNEMREVSEITVMYELTFNPPIPKP